MRIKPVLSDSSAYHRAIKDKSEDDSFDETLKNKQQQQQNETEEQEEQERVKVSEEEVSRAINSFQLDALTQANGLKAEKSGAGPGLRVSLKDAKGKVLRQLSGAEFLELRESVSKKGQKRGKILDTKL